MATAIYVRDQMVYDMYMSNEVCGVARRGKKGKERERGPRQLPMDVCKLKTSSQGIPMTRGQRGMVLLEETGDERRGGTISAPARVVTQCRVLRGARPVWRIRGTLMEN
ncbi:hypothetical protein I307_00643 [Cryptococcus deuterogattii 99/473]|uniref:Uncharacterized protein n=1 Tax=Cryptococcus deuterogattii Ram5 TaxID=1296110 RepID=A0A0D0T713_9TREE|nr:hypothetical protein I309_02784 [Cryptococcus deuterogattii LA55]KIR33564.1 hypothetical protein I352_04336 [Cryptococcus deuterogattii MMRL2647]KIR41692.1 hypothetical protein I313_01849 [Cryptococcus deuterogattii Ram5]KIR73483.1 hypothetical protein I310_03152 [Cryptococcus deuterogattii CA1014]KIR91818.1 hypothetical protein I304_04645 [Cryptococcus deuterogattii CBS 10090]KIR99239.1 hypothetical protein L804_03864 [Cryptococcus deuterogattii 2001/935-1]KIY60194.1 hypothetical protein 